MTISVVEIALFAVIVLLLSKFTFPFQKQDQLGVLGAGVRSCTPDVRFFISSTQTEESLSATANQFNCSLLISLTALKINDGSESSSIWRPQSMFFATIVYTNPSLPKDLRREFLFRNSTVCSQFVHGSATVQPQFLHNSYAIPPKFVRSSDYRNRCAARFLKILFEFA